MQFSSSAEACTALLLDNVEFGDGMLRIDLPPPDFEFPASVNRGPAIVPLPALAVPVAQLPAIAVPLAPPPATVGPPMMMTTPLVQAAIAGRTGIAVPQQRIDEIMRTVHLGNVPTTATDADVIEFLQQIGVPVYIKFSGDASQPFRYAFVEFSDVATAAVRRLGLSALTFANATAESACVQWERYNSRSHNKVRWDILVVDLILR